MKLTKRRRAGYSVLNNDYHSPPHTKRPAVVSAKTPVQSEKTPVSPETISSHRQLISEDLYSYKCTQCPPKDIKQDIRNLPMDVRAHLRHTFMRLRGRPQNRETLEILEQHPNRGPPHADSCPRLLAARSLPTSPSITLEDRYNALQHFARIEKIKNEMEKEKKRIGKLRWTYWKWVDGKQGTRLAEERLVERVECRREEESGGEVEGVGKGGREEGETMD